jgi:hypothetical protein
VHEHRAAGVLGEGVTTRDEIASAAAANPAAVLLVILDELVDVACGTNPALKDFMRERFYQRMLDRLRAHGVKGWR